MADLIETERLILRPWDARYLEDFVRMAADLSVVRYIGGGEAWSRERSEARFRWQLEHWREHGFGWRAAIAKEGGDWLGFVGVNRARSEAIELRPADVEVGWWLIPRAWGRGLATEGARAVCDEAFDVVGLARLNARLQPSNRRSRRIVEKLGMRFERDATGRHGDVVHVYVLERDRWYELRASGSTPAPHVT